MKPIVLAFAGHIASGKSVLSTEVARSLGWRRVSFGDYVRHVAQRRGLGESREALQDAGASLVEQGWDQFCRSVVAQAGWEPGQPLVIDGIRHAEAMDSLRALVAPAVLYLVFVDADRATREARLRERGDVDREQLERIERHSTELQLQTIVPSMANLTVDGTRPVRDLVREIAGWVQNR